MSNSILLMQEENNTLLEEIHDGCETVDHASFVLAKSDALVDILTTSMENDKRMYDNEPTAGSVLMSIEYTKNIATYLGLEAECFSEITTSDIETTPKAMLRVSIEEKDNLIKRALRIIMDTFVKLWNGVKRVAAKAVVYMSNTEKTYDELGKYLDNKKDELHDPLVKTMTPSNIESILNRFIFLFMAEGSLTNSNLNMESYINILTRVPGMAESLFDTVTTSSNAFTKYYGGLIGANALPNPKSTDVTVGYNHTADLAKENEKMSQSIVADIAPLEKIIESIYEEIRKQTEKNGYEFDAVDNGVVLVTKGTGKILRIMTKKITTYEIDGDKVVSKTYKGPVDIKSLTTANKNIIYTSVSFDMKTFTTLGIGYLRSAYGTKIELLTMDNIHKLYAMGKELSGNFKGYTDNCLKYGKGFNKEIKNSTKTMEEVASKLATAKGGIAKKVGETVIYGQRKSLSAIGRTLPGLSLDLVIGYLDLVNNIARTTKIMASYYANKEEAA